jgi:DNA excision repair protein ERCC-6-like
LWGLFRVEKGGVLGDDMGLGKTVQIASFLYGLFSNDHIERALLVMPKSVMLNWENELKKWCPRVRVALFHGTSEKRQRVLDEILETGGIVLTTYGTAQNAVAQ